jgi:hypothetical protein
MRGVVSGGAAARVRGSAPSLSPGAIAWLAVPWCAAVTALAVHLLGPPLGAALFPFPNTAFLPGQREFMWPEPTESARYVLALGGPILLACTVAALSRRAPRLPPVVASVGVALAQAALVAVLVACFVGQHDSQWTTSYFNARTLVVAAFGAIVLLVAARWMRSRDRSRLRLPESPTRRRTIGVVAALVTAIWLLPGVNTATSMDWAYTAHDAAFYFDETLAVLNGLTPHVDFNAQYASLQPFVLGLSLLTFGKTVLVYTITACAITALALMAIYGVLRRATGSAATAFALYLPVMATSLFVVPLLSSGSMRFTAGVYFAMFPLRYAGPCLLAWLVARHLGRERTPPSWPLFLAAGLVVIDNLEFGVAALGATVAALLCTSVRLAPRELLRLAASVAAGLAAALALLTLLGLVRSDSLPDLAAAASFARLYGVVGYYVTPLVGLFGLPFVIYLTYVAAIATATVRAVRRAPGRVLTGMLAWAGVFGLGSAPYYVARSFPFQLPMLFATWALALALLAFVALRHIASAQRFSPASLVPLFGLGLAACSLAQMPAPWAQIQRIERPPPGTRLMEVAWSRPPPQDAGARDFFAAIFDGKRFVVEPGAPVALLITTGHYIADAYGVRNVVPYTGPDSIHTLGELRASLDVLRDAGGNTVVMPLERLPTLGPLLRARGFALLTRDGLRSSWPDEGAPEGTVVLTGFVKLVDVRHLRPAALG